MELTWGLGAQILVTAIIAVVCGTAIATVLVRLVNKALDRRDRKARREELRRRVVRQDDDEIHEDFEHMRVVREHQESTRVGLPATDAAV